MCRYASVWRGTVDAVNANAKLDDPSGVMLYPHVFGAFNHSAEDNFRYPGNDPKWDDFTPIPYNHGVEELWFWTQRPDDLRWAGESRWRSYLADPAPAKVCVCTRARGRGGRARLHRHTK
eukprot:COSAG01_NODE_4899_length_4643_cov_66.442782_5_plen_120_part_00